MSAELAGILGVIAGVLVFAALAGAALYAYNRHKGRPTSLITVIGPALLAALLGVLIVLLR